MYTSYFDFREKPFNVTPDPHFFYANTKYNEAYANLLYGVRERKGFVTLTGEVGTGKTTLLQKLMAELKPSVPFVFFYNTTLTFNELLTYACDELGLEPSGRGQLARIQALNSYLLAQLNRATTVVFFIDEAQHLKDEVFEQLRLLSNLETPREKLLQIVFSGQPELETRLNQPQLRQLQQRISIRSRLGGLSQREIEAFVLHRLRVAGCKKEELFSRDAIETIAAYSNGIPRTINILCDNALLIAYADSRNIVSTEIIHEAANDLGLDLHRHNSSPNTSALTNSLRSEGIDPKSASANNTAIVTSSNGSGPSIAMEGNREATIEASTGPSAKIVALQRDKTIQERVFWNSLTNALTEAMGPMAPHVVNEQITRLNGRSLSRASAERVVESVSSEVLHDILKGRFRKTMAEATAHLI
jgi:general secretion pathway protein A